MGLFSFLGKPEKRAAVVETDPLSWMLSLFGGSTSASGEKVTHDSALRFSAVWACVQVRSESLAQLPLGVFEKVESGKRNRSDHPVYYLVHNQPNPRMSAFTFVKTMQTILDLYGNAYAEIVRDTDNVTVKAFNIIHPDSVSATVKGDSVIYTIKVSATSSRPIQSYNMIHLVGMSFDGIEGKSPVMAHMETVGMALATQKFGSKFYSNGATLNGILKHPGKLTDAAQQRLLSSWQKRYEGGGNAFKTAVLEEGMDYIPIGIKPVEAQYIETSRFSVEEIARIYRVPLHLIGDLSRSTNNNIEEQGISFVRDTMGPIAKTWESELNRKLFVGDSSLYVEFNMNGLLRGNATARADYYMKMVQNGLMNANEVRSLENMNAYEGGDKYMKPLNIGYVGEDDADADTEPEPVIGDNENTNIA